MNIIKSFNDLVSAIKAVWPVLVVVAAFVCSIIVGLMGFGQTIVPLSLPLFVVIAFIALAVYPIIKAIEWLLKKKPVQNFEYSGLLWIPARLRFNNPKAICPEQDCGCEVLTRTERLPSIRKIQSRLVMPEMNDHYTYLCPIHGVLSNVPDISPDSLFMRAKIVQSRQTTKSTPSKSPVA